MTTIDKIRAEINKRYAEYRAKMKTDDFTYYEGMADALDLFEQFLDTLEEPVSEDLEKKTFDDYLKASPAERRKMNMAEILGEERLAKTKEQMDLEEAAEEWVENESYGLPDEVIEMGYIGFKAGAEWQKDKDAEAVIVAEDRGFLKGADWAKAEIMEGAVEGIVEYNFDENSKGYYSIRPTYVEECVGDKVKIIVVKED